MCAIYEQIIATMYNKIVLNSKKTLRRAILRLRTKLHDEFASSKPSKHKTFRKKPSQPPKNHQTQNMDVLSPTPENAD